MTQLAIIGGSGLYQLDSIEVLQEHSISTPFGETSGNIIEARFLGHKVYFLPRHGKNHQISPSEINYCANIYALKSLGVRQLLSVSAVGSLKEELAPGIIFLPDQFIDWTKGLRRRTFFGDGVVGHVSTAIPIEPALLKRVERACMETKVQHIKGGSYICIEGPQFSSKAESHIYRSLGASVIGMTNVPESYLAKEAGMAYATVAMVTDYDCWKEEHCSIEEILKVMSENTKTAHKLLTYLVPDLINNPISYQTENEFSVITKAEFISPEKKAMIQVLLS